MGLAHKGLRKVSCTKAEKHVSYKIYKVIMNLVNIQYTKELLEIYIKRSNFFQKRLSNNEYFQGSKYLPDVSHFSPEKPGLHEHAPSVQVPPFLHGFGLHGSTKILSIDKKMFTQLP